ncbi:Spore germination protein A3 [Sporomusa rhizae]|uniref:Ger(x)C family spore germination protein n=1 Tax=Sporomusa rhizae TaxID=357999 RepID=UPI00352AE50F
MVVHKRLVLAVSLVIIVLFTGGCWDRTEMENRGYVLGGAIDAVLPEAKGRYDLEKAFQDTGTRRYRLSYSLRKFRTGGGEKAGGSKEESIVYSAEGDSMFAATRAMWAEADFGMFLEGMQVLLVNEEVASQGVREVFDFFARNPEMRRRAKIYVTKGRAEDFLRTNSKNGEIRSLSLAKLNDKKVQTFTTASEFGYVSEALHSKRGFVVPVIYLEGDVFKAAGTAIFNGKGQMMGVAGESEAIGGKMWRRTIKQGQIVVPNPEKPDGLVVFELLESKVRVKPDFQGDTIRFILEGEFDGNIGECLPMGEEALNDKFLQMTAQAVTEELTRHAYAAFQRMKDVRAEGAELGDIIRRKNPQYWEQIKDRWDDEVFPTTEADVTIKVKIRGTGMIR